MMKRVLLAAAVAAAAAIPAAAETAATMTCGDYLKQDQETQKQTVEQLNEVVEGMADYGGTPGGRMTSGSDLAANLAAACKDHPDMSLEHAMDAIRKM